jgi:ATP-dependent Lhr-like helicase
MGGRSKTSINRVSNHPQCPHCSARLIAAVKPFDEELYDIVRKKRKNENDKAIELRLIRNANLILSHGKKAIIALTGRGIGPEIAARILSTLTDGDAFYREILKAERNFIRTHRFW